MLLHLELAVVHSLVHFYEEMRCLGLGPPPQIVETEPIHHSTKRVCHRGCNLFSYLIAGKESGGHDLSQAIPWLEIHDHRFLVHAFAWSHQPHCWNSNCMVGEDCYVSQLFFLFPFQLLWFPWLVNPLAPQEGTIEEALNIYFFIQSVGGDSKGWQMTEPPFPFRRRYWQ